MKGSGIIGAYHVRRVVPLMRRTLPLHMTAPVASFDGTALIEGALSPFEVAQRIKVATEPSRDDAGAVLDFVYTVLGHPRMWPESGYIVFISFLSSCLLFN